MKFRLISDNRDSADGFRLAGVGGVLADDDASALGAIRDAACDPEVGIVLITDKLYSRHKDEIVKLRSSFPDCLFVGIPDREGGSGSTDDMLAFVREAVGIEI